MLSGSSFPHGGGDRGGGRRGGGSRGGGRGHFGYDDTPASLPRLQFHGPFDLAFGNRSRGTISNIAILMVSIAAWGSTTPSRVTVDMTVVEACLEKLKDDGYFVPYFSYF
ncbi:hypothetical protein SETIT_5G168900v2 [Setaria italica]|uniref:Uncharacterized protein n=1 Tax=Setaria italica TaxID=4555 RepID=A0A368R5V6_SETIT|nr:hypothetical protein SETIT_5G168900v2 [Setaria italica]